MQPLTKKAKAGITAYVNYQGDRKGHYLHFLIDWTLKAERMQREKLYTWLKEHGYSWRPKIGRWIK